MMERQVETKEAIALSDDEVCPNSDSSSDRSAEMTFSREKNASDVTDDQEFLSDEDENDDSDHCDDGIDKSNRKSVLEMANAIEASISLKSPVVRKSAVTLSGADYAGIPTANEPQSQFWSLQGGRRSSITSNLSKIKRPHPTPISKSSPAPEPKETLDVASLHLSSLPISPVTSSAAIMCSFSPSPELQQPKPTKSSNRTATTRETLEGSGPKVRMTRSAMLLHKGKRKQQQHQTKKDEAALKPRTNGLFHNNNKSRPPSKISRPEDYPKPRLVVSDSKNSATRTRTKRAAAPQEPTPSNKPGKEPQISQLPGRRRSHPNPAANTTTTTTTTSTQPGKVRLTRSAMLKLRQSQERAAAQMTQQDLDNQRLGIPPVKFLNIPGSPTKINFEDDEMEHPNDIARRKLREIFDDESKPKAR